jgi:hypothetical protein
MKTLPAAWSFATPNGQADLSSHSDPIDLLLTARWPPRSNSREANGAASVHASHGIVEHAIFGEDLVNRRAKTRWVVLAEDLVKIAGQQGRYAVGHGRCLSSLDWAPLALMHQAA